MDNDDYYQDDLLLSAIEQWESGRQVSLTMAIELIARGYDVTALEEKHHLN